jgi:hypothetical protein
MKKLLLIALVALTGAQVFACGCLAKRVNGQATAQNK